MVPQFDRLTPRILIFEWRTIIICDWGQVSFVCVTELAYLRYVYDQSFWCTRGRVHDCLGAHLSSPQYQLRFF